MKVAQHFEMRQSFAKELAEDALGSKKVFLNFCATERHL